MHHDANPMPRNRNSDTATPSHRHPEALTKKPLPTSPRHSPLHTLKTHARKPRTPTLTIPLIPPQRLPQMRRSQWPFISHIQPLLQPLIFIDLDQILLATNLIGIQSCVLNLAQVGSTAGTMVPRVL